MSHSKRATKTKGEEENKEEELLRCRKEELRCELLLDFRQCCISSSVTDVRYYVLDSRVPACAGFLPPLSVQADVDIKVSVFCSRSVLSER